MAKSIPYRPPVSGGSARPGLRRSGFRTSRSGLPPLIPSIPRIFAILLPLPVLLLVGPLPEALQSPPEPHPILLDRYGRELTDFPRPDFFRHRTTSLDEIPDHLVKATLAAEDKRFFEHPGIDYLSVGRALFQNIQNGEVTSGASTITQQLVKISTPPEARDLGTKIREMVIARRLESRWSKDQILAAYLNRLDYGSHRQGCAEAALHFFGKPLGDLSLAEAALLAGLPQAPSRLNPRRHPEAAVARRNWILDRLQAEFGYSPELIEIAKSQPLVLQTPNQGNPIPHLGSRPSRSARTSIDTGLQKATGQILREQLHQLNLKNVQHGALVILKNDTGEILAFHGSPDFSSPNGGQINGALSPRSAGSTLKPFTYALAFENQGLFPGTIIPDIPTDYRTAEGLEAPKNFDRRHHGPVSIRQALATSLNVAAMGMLNQLGGPEPLYQLLNDLGLGLTGSATEHGLGLTIGNAEVTLLALTNAYATLARLGEHFPVTFLVAAEENKADASIPLSSESCFLVADILADHHARAPAFGINSSLRLPFPCAVKTGTSSDFRDNWCLGFTNDFTVGVWVGNFDNSPMAGVSGVTGAGSIFHQTMMALHEDHLPSFPGKPESLVTLSIDSRTGHYFPVPPPPSTAWLRQELCPRDHFPLAVSPADYDNGKRARLNRNFEEWFHSPDNNKSHAFALSPFKPLTRMTLRALAPLPGATYYLDPELPGSSDQLSLKANLPNVAWSSPTLKIHQNVATLVPGTHEIFLTHLESNQSFTCKFTVETL